MPSNVICTEVLVNGLNSFPAVKMHIAYSGIMPSNIIHIVQLHNNFDKPEQNLDKQTMVVLITQLDT